MDNHFKNTSEWLRKTQENKLHEQEYYRRLSNKEDVSMFKTQRNRTRTVLFPKHNILRCDDTLYQFIVETTQTIEKLNERIAELEKSANIHAL
jgi:hypothetical protein